MEIIAFRDVPRKGRPVDAPSSNNNAGFANVDISLVLLVPGMDFGPVPGKKYGIPLVSGA